MENKLKVKDFLPVFVKLFVVAGVICGVTSTANSGGDFMSRAAFLFFTVQSNVTIGVMCLIFAVFDTVGLIKGKKLEIPQWLYVLKFIFTVAITLTFLVFGLMLTPQMVAQGNAAYLASASNIFCHNLVPIVAIIDFILYDYKYQSGDYSFLWGALMPLYYMCFALIGSVSGINFGGGAKVPYFFFDYEANSWFLIGGGKFGTFWWIMILVVVVLLEGKFFIWAKNKMQVRAMVADESYQPLKELNENN